MDAPPTMKYIQLEALRMAYLDDGQGPLVVMLHGFPDRPETWSHQASALVAQGYRVVRPYLRGYPPTDLGQGGYYDKATLVKDIAQFIQALNPGQTCHLVGQDWGAIIGYALLAAHPELFARAVLMAVPHPLEVAKSLLNPRHVHRSFHWWFFQLPDLPEQALAQDGMHFIDYLWDYWTVEGFEDTAHIASVKDLLSQPGALSATLGYYRAMFDTSKADPKLADLRALMSRPIAVPTLALCGAQDMRAELMHDQAQYFTGPYAFELINNAGHFLHRENPAPVTQAMSNWLAQV
jgi:pimeloyl-ACP methyl ester carboxylesterase